MLWKNKSGCKAGCHCDKSMLKSVNQGQNTDTCRQCYHAYKKQVYLNCWTIKKELEQQTCLLKQRSRLRPFENIALKKLHLFTSYCKFSEQLIFWVPLRSFFLKNYATSFVKGNYLAPQSCLRLCTPPQLCLCCHITLPPLHFYYFHMEKSNQLNPSI